VPWLAAMLLAAAPGSAETGAPDPARLEEAKRHMKAGAAFYNDPSGHKCEEALREFRKAYALSGSLNAVKGMAICALELERDGESIDLYATYLASKGASIDPAERAQVESDLNTLRAAVATVTLSADHHDVRVTDVRTPAKGYPIRNSYTLPAKLGLHPGQHVITATVDGQPDQPWRVEIANGGTYAHTFTFASAVTMGGPERAPQAPPVVTERPVPASVWATLGLTVALAVPWTVLAVRAKGKDDAYNQQNHHASAAVLTDLQSGVKSANVLADVFLGATLASLTVTALLFFTRPTRRANPQTNTQTLTLAPLVGVSSGGAVASGWF